MEKLDPSICCSHLLQKWYIGIVEDISIEYQGVKINIMIPTGHFVSFLWPKNHD